MKRLSLILVTAVAILLMNWPLLSHAALCSRDQWCLEETPVDQDLHGIWGSGPNDVYAVGTSGTILHFNGSSWSQKNSGTTADLGGIWGSGPDDVYVVGQGGTILHYDGSIWEEMNSGTTCTLNDIWGSGPDDVFAVGSCGNIHHYDGSFWQKIITITKPYLDQDRYYGIWGSGPNNVYVVGFDFNIIGIILHYNGSAWSQMELGLGIGVYNRFYDIWGSGPNDVYVVGYQGTAIWYNGSAWYNMQSSTDTTLRGVWNSALGDVYAVGDPRCYYWIDGAFCAGWVSAILHHDGGHWSFMDTNTGGILFGVWGSSRKDVFTVGENGLILHRHIEAFPWAMFLPAIIRNAKP